LLYQGLVRLIKLKGVQQRLGPLFFLTDGMKVAIEPSHRLQLKRMKILLINPKPSVWNAPRVPPLGLGYVASSLEQAGHSVSIWDSAVDETGPDFSGFQLVGATAATTQVKEAWRMLARAKSSGCLTMLGGPHATCLPEESLSKGVDFVVRQEGEKTVVELADRLSSNAVPVGIQGMSWKKGGLVINEPDRPLIGDLDSIPFPAHHLFPDLHNYTSPQPLISRRSPALGIFTSRGCPFGCVFCFKGVFGRSFRARSPENVVAEWEVLVGKYGVKEIAVQDDAFNTDEKRALEICRLIIKKGLVIPWSTPNGIRADLATPELLAAMKESGCERVAFGVESGNELVLKSIDKRINLSQVEDAFKSARRVGLKTMAFFMFGNPGEDRQAMEDTIKFAIKLNPDLAQFTLATPYPGTRLNEIVRRSGELLVDDWDDFGHYTSKGFFRMGETTPELLSIQLPRAYRRFYLHPNRLAAMAANPDTWRNLGNMIRGAWHLMVKA